MRIIGFIWLDEIVEKLATKHRVEVREVEELFGNGPKFRFVEAAGAPAKTFTPPWDGLMQGGI